MLKPGPVLGAITLPNAMVADHTTSRLDTVILVRVVSRRQYGAGQLECSVMRFDALPDAAQPRPAAGVRAAAAVVGDFRA